MHELIQTHVIGPVLRRNYPVVIAGIQTVLDALYASIPSTQRGSYGRVYTMVVLSGHLVTVLTAQGAPLFEVGSTLFTQSAAWQSKGVAVDLLSWYGLADSPRVLPFFTDAASSPDWKLRDFAQMSFRKLIQKHPTAMHAFLWGLVHSCDANLRRFVSETLRPVKENRWFYRHPEYPLSLLRPLFHETAVYPRTSVGNNLSDLARRLPDLVFLVVQDLVARGDVNAYWIAYRACRNLVKAEPLRVMDLLGVDEYRYKRQVYQRRDYSRD